MALFEFECAHAAYNGEWVLHEPMRKLFVIARGD